MLDGLGILSAILSIRQWFKEETTPIRGPEWYWDNERESQDIINGVSFQERQRRYETGYYWSHGTKPEPRYKYTDTKAYKADVRALDQALLDGKISKEEQAKEFLRLVRKKENGGYDLMLTMEEIKERGMHL